MARAGSTLEQVTLLIVDDQAVIRATLRDFLQSTFPGIRILEAATGARALDICLEHRPQLVLMDICLPDANGIELTARLVTAMPRLAVIVISYFSGQNYVEEAFAAGALAYVVKDRLLVDMIPAVADALGIAPTGGKKWP